MIIAQVDVTVPRHVHESCLQFVADTSPLVKHDMEWQLRRQPPPHTMHTTLAIWSSC